MPKNASCFFVTIPQLNGKGILLYKKILIGAISLLVATQALQARPAPLGSEKRLASKSSSFRELIVDCTERSKSLSCHRAGVYYINERSDYINGTDYLNQACKLGRGYSCTLLGTYYEIGEIVAKDIAKAKDYYNKGCLRGSETGCEKFNTTIIPPVVKKKAWYHILFK